MKKSLLLILLLFPILLQNYALAQMQPPPYMYPPPPYTYPPTPPTYTDNAANEADKMQQPGNNKNYMEPPLYFNEQQSGQIPVYPYNAPPMQPSYSPGYPPVYSPYPDYEADTYSKDIYNETVPQEAPGMHAPPRSREIYDPQSMYTEIEDANDRFTQSYSSIWQVSFGAGLGYLPKFEGAGDNEALFVPLLDVVYADTFFIHTLKGAGIYLFKGPMYKFGPYISYHRGRDISDAPYLTGTREVDIAFESGLFAEIYFGNLTFKWDVSHDSFNMGHHGITSTFGASYKFAVMPSFDVNTGISSQWADENYMQSMFGITAEEAQVSSLSQYSASSGFKDITFDADLVYKINDKWDIRLLGEAKKLIGDAKNSPIVKAGSDTQLTTGAGIMYKF